MSDLYRDEIMTVSKGWLTGWKVRSASTGAQYIPPLIFQERIGFCLARLKRDKTLLPEMKEAVTKMLFRYFGLATMDPSSPIADVFHRLQPPELTDEIIRDTMAILNQLREDARNSLG